jgi:hypothetical protein
MARNLTYDSEKGYHVSHDIVLPSPGTSEGLYVNPGDDPESENTQPIRSLVFKSADDSNVKVWTSYDSVKQALEVTIGVYYV